MQFIYLLQEREFINAKKPIYKIGRTKDSIKNRTNKYPKDSDIIYSMPVTDCIAIETKLLNVLAAKFIQRKDIGDEYFEGDVLDMVSVITDTIEKSKLKKESTIKFIDLTSLVAYYDIPLVKEAIKCLSEKYGLNLDKSNVFLFLLSGVLDILLANKNADILNIYRKYKMGEIFENHYTNERILNFYFYDIDLSVDDKEKNCVLATSKDKKLFTHYIDFLKNKITYVDFYTILYPLNVKKNKKKHKMLKNCGYEKSEHTDDVTVVIDHVNNTTDTICIDKSANTICIDNKKSNNTFTRDTNIVINNSKNKKTNDDVNHILDIGPVDSVVQNVAVVEINPIDFDQPRVLASTDICRQCVIKLSDKFDLQLCPSTSNGLFLYKCLMIIFNNDFSYTHISTILNGDGIVDEKLLYDLFLAIRNEDILSFVLDIILGCNYTPSYLDNKLIELNEKKINVLQMYIMYFSNKIWLNQFKNILNINI